MTQIHLYVTEISVDFEQELSMLQGLQINVSMIKLKILGYHLDGGRIRLRLLISQFLFGAASYELIELIYRRRTHWTMAVTGGVCFVCLSAICGTGWPMPFQYVAGMIIITVIEFTVGCIVNLKLKWKVWDYSDKKYNILGQVCPAYMLAWLFLSAPALWIARFLFG